MKVIPTPRIKLKHNDISDEEFRLLMEHQRVITEVRVYVLLPFVVNVYILRFSVFRTPCTINWFLIKDWWLCFICIIQEDTSNDYEYIPATVSASDMKKEQSSSFSRPITSSDSDMSKWKYWRLNIDKLINLIDFQAMTNWKSIVAVMTIMMTWMTVCTIIVIATIHRNRPNKRV